jgi:poly(3-hydroxybutyrate) depolymerase
MDTASAIPNSFFRLPMWENTSLYHMHELQHAAMAPISFMAQMNKMAYHSPMNPMSYTPVGRSIAAGSELLERMTKRYAKPEFGIESVEMNGTEVAVSETIVDVRPFCNLIHLKKETTKSTPKLLVVAPMSGHYATLLRGTVQDLLPHADVYITDWVDARDIPVLVGKFDLDDYIQYVIDYLKLLGPDVHVMAVCQPAVPVLAAVSIMSANLDPNVPRSMTLIGGPIDTREAPTEVNRTAKEKPFSWFEQNVVTRVPANYPGFMRRVYPGFLQLTGFMTLNMERHIGAHIDLFKHLVQGDGESVNAHKKFYNEYLSVMDITAEFYLQTIDTVFQRHLLPKGEMKWRGVRVDPKAITQTALLTIEGEKDDISGVGQTFATHRLCVNLPASKRHHHLQEGVGHYGIFNGRKFRDAIVPLITKFMHKHA